MAGFILKNTLSESGVVIRGICKINEAGYLTIMDEARSSVTCCRVVHYGFVLSESRLFYRAERLLE